MSQAYALHVLKVAVAKICQTIGWHSTHTTTIDLLIDVTQHFLREISRIMMRYSELYNRTEPNLDDLALAYRDININMQELMEYIQFVDPIALPFAVPRFPLPRESNLSFLKPGSREMMMRPLHIPWYMPPMFPELEDAERTDGSSVAGHDDEKKALVRADADGLAKRKAIDGSTDGSLAAAVLDDSELKLVHESATLTEITIDETGEKLVTGETIVLVDDGTLAPEAVASEEVEIPMQTLELKETTPEKAPAPDGSTSCGEPDAASETRPEPGQAEQDKQGDAAGGKGNAGDSRPTRNISSVIMTTSGFISPAREGKLPDSRIPIIPEERPPQRTLPPPAAPICAPSATLPVSCNAGVSAAAQNVAAPPSIASGASAHPLHPALLPTLAQPHPRDLKHGNVSSSGPLPVGTPFAALAATAPASVVAAAASLAVSGSKQPGGGEKVSKKVKKKPLDRERKKGDKKGIASGEKQAGSERANMTKPTPMSELSIGSEWNAMQSSAVLRPGDYAAPGVVQPSVATVAPFLPVATIGASHSAASSVSSTQFSDTATIAGKAVKPSKTKLGKEKLLKKRKLLATEVGPTFPSPDAGALTATATTTSTGPDLLTPASQPQKQPKVKSVAKRLKQARKLLALQAGVEQQVLLLDAARGQLDQQIPGAVIPNQPPPLIDPWRVGAFPAGEKLGLPGAVTSVGEVGKAHGSGKQKAAGKQQKSEVQTNEQAAQLSLLQKMHPSLEITASPAPDQPPTRPPGSSKKSNTKSKLDGKAPVVPSPAAAAVVPTFATDRDVIVIDDDKSPPHTPSLLMASPGATDGKRQRKQASVGPFYSQEHVLGELASPPGVGPLTFRDFSSPEGHASGAIPKTPDIKLPSSSSAGSLASEASGRTSKNVSRASRIGDLFPEAGESKPPESLWTANRTTLGSPAVPEKKQKRPKQKPPKGSTDGAKQPKIVQSQSAEQQQQQQQQQSDHQDPPGASRNPFALFGPGGAGLGPYGNYLSQSLNARMPFGLFPFPSGPGLIPDGPLFPLQPGGYPMGPGNFSLPANPFGMPGLGAQINNMLRMPRPTTNRNPLGGPGGGSLNPYQHHLFDDNLDPETKLAQTPLDLQKSNCNVAPLVPPSLFQAVTGKGGEESLNLSLKLSSGAGATGGSSTGTGTTTKQTATVVPHKKGLPVSSTVTATATATASASNTNSSSSQPASFLGSGGLGELGATQEPPPRVPDSRREDQVVILPAASVLLGASPPQRSSVCVIDIDDSDGSQSTTTGDRSKDGRRKGAGKEHKKERKLKDGKVKKKKDKKDKSRSKEREREQQLKELSAGTASSSAIMTMGMIGAEEALMEQLRKERKEKKEKRKDKVKKEKRKERERMLLAGGTDQSGQVALAGSSSAAVDAPAGGAGEPSGACAAVPKLIMKLGGSVTTPSPRSDTPDHQHHLAAVGATGSEHKRDANSPELARISALVTRPPKLKVPSGPSSSSSKGKKDESPTKAGMGVVGATDGGSGGGSADHGQHGQAGFEASDTGKHAVGLGSAPVAGDTVDPTHGFGGGSGAPLAGGAAVSKVSGKSARGTSVSLGGGIENVSSSGSKSSAGDAGGSRKAPKDSGSSKGSKSSYSSAHHQHHHHAAPSTMAAPAHMTDADGNTVWICPACGRVDDGTPMIGCDGCDAWYHWVCVGIQVPPDDNEDWYCRVCIGKKQDSHTDAEKQRKRKKKDKKTSKD